MQSSELARLTGVSVRTLRHYHQVGVLDEPERGSNGYRRYDVHDLVRVLRIRRLAALGVPLDQVPAILDDDDRRGGRDARPDRERLLDDLDRELAHQMDRFARQRAAIARLRDLRSDPDVPPELAPFVGVFPSEGVWARIDRDQAVLLAHLAGEEGLPHLAHLYERLSDPGRVANGGDLTVRFDGLGASSTDDEVTALVEDFLTAYGPVVDELDAEEFPLDLSGAQKYVTEYNAGMLNEQQRRALELLGERLAERSTADP